jgi:hypothetical protein
VAAISYAIKTNTPTNQAESPEIVTSDAVKVASMIFASTSLGIDALVRRGFGQLDSQPRFNI